MLRSSFARNLKKIHRGLTVLRYSNRGEHRLHGGNDALYFYDKLIGAVPTGNIFVSGNVLYRGEKYRNRSLRGVLGRLTAKGAIWGSKINKAKEVLYGKDSAS